MDKKSDVPVTDSASDNAGRSPDSTRRRFSRNAIAGSAVFLSLGNRAAWGQATVVGCMSLTTLNSFNPTTGMFASTPTGQLGHDPDLAADIHSIGAPPDYIGSNGVQSTCPDPDDPDLVCLVDAPACPQAASSSLLDPDLGDKSASQIDLLFKD